MAATNSLKTDAEMSKFIARLRTDYPDFKFKRGHQEHWSSKTKTITYNPQQDEKHLKFGVFHELAHAILEHKNYTSDLELLKLEAEAWNLAARIGRKYGVKISENHIQKCLDTYRDWLHKRSRCPKCGMHVVQQTADTYKCFNCQTIWKVTHRRFARPYRLSKSFR